MDSFSCGITRRTALQQLATLAASGFLAPVPALWAGAPDGIVGGPLPDDRRLGPLKDLDGYFPFSVPSSPGEWEARAERVRRQILIACGLWPMPTKPPIAATIHGKVDRPEYTVEKVYFESFPGLYVTGNLYRPKGRSGARPVILSPHGHWTDGRFHDLGEEGVRQEIASGAERFERGGRHPLQARCVQLARMGCIVFMYDMLGYADSAPLSLALVHRFARQREAMTRPDHWGLFSAQAELRLINAMGLQTLNSIRALDWVLTLPEVDRERVGVTGASGGGTQTFVLAGLDPRVTAAFPAVMVSTAMQGGCTCENASYLRIDTGNVEFAALTAPRPLGLTAANDWTKELETRGLPELQEHYARLGTPGNVEGRYFDFDHNYNAVSRRMMYEFFDRHFELGYVGLIEEHDYRPLSVAEMSVWDDRHPKPAGGDAAERALMAALDEDARRQIAALRPRDARSLREYRRVVGGALEVMIGRGLPDPREVAFEQTAESTIGGGKAVTGRLRYLPAGEELPAVLLMPRNWNRQAVVWIHGGGKAGVYGDAGEVQPEVRRLLDAGAAVAGLDLLYQGDFLTDGRPLVQTRSVDNPREFAGYTLGYNHPLFAQRVHDVLTMIAFLRSPYLDPAEVHLVGVGGGAAWAAVAAALAGDAVAKVAVDSRGFRFATITDIRDPNLLPGVVRYGDLPGMLALITPHQLWLGGEGITAPEVVSSAYAAAGAASRLTTYGGVEGRTEAMARWLIAS